MQNSKTQQEMEAEIKALSESVQEALNLAMEAAVQLDAERVHSRTIRIFCWIEAGMIALLLWWIVLKKVL